MLEKPPIGTGKAKQQGEEDNEDKAVQNGRFNHERFLSRTFRAPSHKVGRDRCRKEAEEAANDGSGDALSCPMIIRSFLSSCNAQRPS